MHKRTESDCALKELKYAVASSTENQGDSKSAYMETTVAGQREAERLLMASTLD